MDVDHFSALITTRVPFWLEKTKADFVFDYVGANNIQGPVTD
jgi:hypothetical protein